MTIILSQCFECKYYNRYDNNKHSCKAFPNGIPKKVFENIIKHDQKIKGQTGDYVYEEKK